MPQVRDQYFFRVSTHRRSLFAGFVAQGRHSPASGASRILLKALQPGARGLSPVEPLASQEDALWTDAKIPPAPHRADLAVHLCGKLGLGHIFVEERNGLRTAVLVVFIVRHGCALRAQGISMPLLLRRRAP